MHWSGRAAQKPSCSALRFLNKSAHGKAVRVAVAPPEEGARLGPFARRRQLLVPEASEAEAADPSAGIQVLQPLCILYSSHLPLTPTGFRDSNRVVFAGPCVQVQDGKEGRA